MRKTIQSSLALLIAVCGLLSALPASADVRAATSGDVRPLKGKSLVYESYVSDNPKDCKEIYDDTVQFSGGGSIFVGAGTWPSAYRKPMNLQCETNYVMVTLNTQTTGALSTVIAGAITNNGRAMCCPVKYRWAAAKT